MQVSADSSRSPSSLSLVHDNRHAAHGIQVDKRARAGRLQLHQVRSAGACRVPVVHRDGMPRRLGDGGQMEHRVGGSAESHIAFHGIVDRRRRHEVAEVDAALEQLHDLHARMLGKAKALEYTAGMVPFPGSAMPSASHRQFMEFAVNKQGP